MRNYRPERRHGETRSQYLERKCLYFENKSIERLSLRDMNLLKLPNEHPNEPYKKEEKQKSKRIAVYGCVRVAGLMEEKEKVEQEAKEKQKRREEAEAFEAPVKHLLIQFNRIHVR